MNGPQDGHLDWDAIYWRPLEDDVRRLRHRIFKASQEWDRKRVRNLQKLGQQPVVVDTVERADRSASRTH